MEAKATPSPIVSGRCVALASGRRRRPHQIWATPVAQTLGREGGGALAVEGDAVAHRIGRRVALTRSGRRRRPDLGKGRGVGRGRRSPRHGATPVAQTFSGLGDRREGEGVRWVGWWGSDGVGWRGEAMGWGLLSFSISESSTSAQQLRMALSTAKFTELQPHLLSAFSIPRRKLPRSSFLLFKPFSSSVRSTKLPNTSSKNPNWPRTSSSGSSSWINKWPSPPPAPPPPPKAGAKNTEAKTETIRGGTTAIDRIVLRLRNLGLGSDDEEEEEGEGGLAGDLLKRDWVRPDTILVENDDYDSDSLLPWERGVNEDEGMDEDRVAVKKRPMRAPTLAELTLEDEELRRLRRMGMTLRERVNVPKAGITGAVLEKIHDKWRKSELVRLKFHEDLAHDMKTAHEIVERRTGGLVTWSVSSLDNLVTRTGDGKSPVIEKSNQIVSARAESMSEEEAEYNRLLDGLGPRFEDWWGTGVLPVDADLLPQTIPGYKTPFRLLPAGMRPRLTNAEMTNLRKLAKSLPCHFALGRNRNHQGLATSIIKLWEKSLLVKIAVKRGIQNTNNKIMAEELKKLTGGVLLLRNKYYIVMYRGKDFVSPSVAAALAERQEMTKQIQDIEEKVRGGPVAVPVAEEKEALAGTLAEFYEAQARWGTTISAEEREKMIEEASRANRDRVIRRFEHKIAIVSSGKELKAEKLLSKIVASWVPVSPSDDQETITDEERVMYRRVGLRMKAYLPLGIRGVFDGVIENMHLHWKHRELVKLISKEKELAFVEETARLLEYESGGILVAIERVPKGHALIYYRGKNYRRPITLRPRNLLTKAKALKRRVALQRYEALSQHISELEKTIEQMKQEITILSAATLNHLSFPITILKLNDKMDIWDVDIITMNGENRNGNSANLENKQHWNSEDSELSESEDDASSMASDGDEDEDEWGDDEDFEFSGLEGADFPSHKAG
ncbi:UNVERIFIED_CONTAM: CRM-domain containing factor CFM3, chloroplastic/mitochondrial [Sesamum calycinum]|uniref:CRM-domain containing factor CFM3, chloroplastic/mitochondrial n=1 Tax=Sesamum calycinum TaxID=2727403 RepID=A0AAW2NHL9_9LAMI